MYLSLCGKGQNVMNAASPSLSPFPPSLLSLLPFHHLSPSLHPISSQLPSSPPSTAPRRGGSMSTPHGAATSQAIQLQQYKQRLQQMHQQLVLGQQQLSELKKNPNQAQKVRSTCVVRSISVAEAVEDCKCWQLSGCHWRLS